jgi:DNA sulfur modification protein DndD
MILQRLTVRNFRQFRGEHTIDFATSADQNVTLILGYNTFGKSSLLNAINFALYGEVQPDFDEPDDLLNHAGSAAKENQVEVKLRFEFQQREYEVTRKRTYTYHSNSRRSAIDEAVMAEIRRSNGSWIGVPHYQRLINRAIPKEMAPNFIFHGEKRVGLFASKGTHRQISDAIRNILGCNVIEAAIKDLLVIQKRLNRNIARESGDEQIELFQKSIESFERVIEDTRRMIREKEDFIEASKIQTALLEQQLRDHEQTKQLQVERDRAKARLQTAEAGRQAAQKEIHKWIRESAAMVGSAALSEAVLDAIDEEEFRGRIPSDFQDSFIQGLLNAKLCICGRSVEKGGEAWVAVEALLTQGGRKDVIDIALKAKSTADRFSRSIAKARSDVGFYEDRVRSFEKDLNAASRDFEELSARLNGTNIEALAEKAKDRERLEAEVVTEQRRIGDLDRKIRVDLEPELNKVKGEYARRIKSKPEMEKRRITLNIVEELGVFLVEQMDFYERQAREQVLELTNQNLSSMHRDKEAFFDGKFNLTLRDRLTKLQSGKSTGEAQLLVLAFTSALIHFCSGREADENEFLVPGTVAPLVLDAPFGQLDSLFQAGAISWIPKMARQVILFVSDTQARTLQESVEIMERVGTCYALQIPQGEKHLQPYSIRGASVASLNNRSDNSTSLVRVW